MKSNNLSEDEDISLSYFILQISLFLFVTFVYIAIFFMAYMMGYETEENPGVTFYPPIFLALKQCVVIIFNLFILYWFLGKFLPKRSLFLEVFILISFILIFFVLLPFLIFKNLFLMWWPAILFMPLFMASYVACTTLRAYLKQRNSKSSRSEN